MEEMSEVKPVEIPEAMLAVIQIVIQMVTASQINPEEVEVEEMSEVKSVEKLEVKPVEKLEVKPVEIQAVTQMVTASQTSLHLFLRYIQVSIPVIAQTRQKSVCQIPR